MSMRWLSLLLLLSLTCPLAADDKHLRDLGFVAARLRQLPYRPIKSREVSQAECATYVKGLLNKEMKPNETLRREAFLRHLGLLTDRRPLKRIYLDLLADQVRGLYDPKRKLFLVVHGSPVNFVERGVGFMFSLMGVDITDVFTVHELTHAVQDQHFNLDKLIKQVPSDFDRELALQSLVEGDATYVMWEYTVSGRPPQAREDFLQKVCRYPLDDNGDLFLTGAAAATPLFVRETLNFPYLGGSAFVRGFILRGGWPALNRVYVNPPQSTAEIFHPETYPNRPIRLQLERLALGPGFKSVGQDSAGEFTIRILARTQGFNQQRICGWLGDHYEVYQGPSGSAIVWDSRWERKGQAIYFMSLLAKTLSRTRGDKTWKSSGGEDGVFVWNKDGLRSQLQCRGRNVRVIMDCPRPPHDGVLLPLK